MTRISFQDADLTWTALDEAINAGRGALDRAAKAHGVGRAVVMHAIGRVEKAFGGRPFFEVKGERRSGRLSGPGYRFHADAEAWLEAWRELHKSMKPKAEP